MTIILSYKNNVIFLIYFYCHNAWMAVTNFKTFSLEEGNRKLTGKIKKTNSSFSIILDYKLLFPARLVWKDFYKEQRKVLLAKKESLKKETDNVARQWPLVS